MHNETFVITVNLWPLQGSFLVRKGVGGKFPYTGVGGKFPTNPAPLASVSQSVTVKEYKPTRLVNIA